MRNASVPLYSKNCWHELGFRTTHTTVITNTAIIEATHDLWKQRHVRCRSPKILSNASMKHCGLSTIVCEIDFAATLLIQSAALLLASGVTVSSIAWNNNKIPLIKATQMITSALIPTVMCSLLFQDIEETFILRGYLLLTGHIVLLILIS